jgi:HEAT repeat protein
MNVSARSAQDGAHPQGNVDDGATLKAAGAWLGQFARTLKTSRLYDAKNPTVVKFRDDLALSARKVLAEYGALTFEFRSDDVLFDEMSLYPARSRDDNLALPFYRDGVRSLTLQPGVEPREIDALLDAVLQVTGQNPGDDDLVTLLWEAQLNHVLIDYVPGEGDVGGGAAQAAESGPMLPWPTNGIDDSDEASQIASGEEPAAGSNADRATRSDDWSTSDLTEEIEAGFEELDALSQTERERFLRDYYAEHAVPTVTSMLAVAHAFLAAGVYAEDRAEMGRFLPRVLKLSVAAGAWLEAREALALLRSCGATDWSAETFAQEQLQPISVAQTVERVDARDGASVQEFIAFARELGEPAADWLNLVLAESQNRHVRLAAAEAIADLCRSQPDRLAPWLSDPRWFVVRNVVHILGWIGGNGIVGMLQTVVRHPDVRVRQEVVAALAKVDSKLARPLLVRMLEGADTRMFCMVLHQLSSNRDAQSARLLMTYMMDEAFEARPQEEKHAIYSTLSSVGGDEIVPELEAEMHKGNWFARSQDSHRAAVARCLARLGTPLSRMVLERGAQSKRAPVRKACEDALTGINGRE